MKTLPPLIKIYEAWSAIADGRVHIDGANLATVTSSDGAKTYTIYYDAATDTYQSNDNATRWQGYPGYPILAVMMVRGRLPLDYGQAQQWQGINWTALNMRFRRDYDAAVRHVEQQRHIDHAYALEKAQTAMSILEALPIKVQTLNVAPVGREAATAV